ncbi:hypothetical protein B0H15DRAFT_957781 [Mycena belliarum]|uniref:Uncharacterized protein n=1 Tax=Mycena belliarum TaxID=1033014 RepID=A0AAD6TPA2_9AGAR|nr:hypothetical protein B0H15DRAFT_957781 [Mycena belliae]
MPLSELQPRGNISIKTPRWYLPVSARRFTGPYVGAVSHSSESAPFCVLAHSGLASRERARRFPAGDSCELRAHARCSTRPCVLRLTIEHYPASIGAVYEPLSWRSTVIAGPPVSDDFGAARSGPSRLPPYPASGSLRRLGVGAMRSRRPESKHRTAARPFS